MPETPLIASSIGSTTDVDISSGLAPGRSRATLTVAGSALGNEVDAEAAERERPEHDQRHDEHRGETGRRTQSSESTRSSLRSGCSRTA